MDEAGKIINIDIDPSQQNSEEQQIMKDRFNRILENSEFTSEDGKKVYHLVLAEEVSFFNKASVIKTLSGIPADSRVIIDCSNSKSIAYDVIELIKDYQSNAKTKNIRVELIKFPEQKN